MSKVFMRFVEHGNYDEELFTAIQNINKDSFKTILWQQLDDERIRTRYIQELLKHPAFIVDIAKFNNGDRVDTAVWCHKNFIGYQKLSPVSYQPFVVERKLNQIKQWTLELLQERVQEKPNSRAAIENFLEFTNDLEIM